MLIIDIFLFAILLSIITKERAEIFLPIVSAVVALIVYVFNLTGIISAFFPLSISMLLIGLIVLATIIWRKRKTIDPSKYYIFLLVQAVALITITLCSFISVSVDVSSEDYYQVVRSMYEGRLSGNNSSIGLLTCFEYAMAKGCFSISESIILYSKNCYIIMMLVPILSRVTFQGKGNRKIFLGLLIALSYICLIYLTAVHSELTSLRPYVAVGATMGAVLFYYFEWVRCKSRLFFNGALFMSLATCLTSRIGIIAVASFVSGCVICSFVRYIYVTVIENAGVLSVAISAGTLLFTILIYVLREKVLCVNDFATDVTNTYLSSVFTTRRYSFGIFNGIPIAFFMILAGLVFAIAQMLDKKIRFIHNYEILFAKVYVAALIFISTLWVLYVVVFAKNNIANGEYLTLFEDYIQIPVIMVLTIGGYLAVLMTKESDKEII